MGTESADMKGTQMIHLQQGDLLFQKIEAVPSGTETVKRKERGFVLAEGEHTGNAHVITEEVELFEKNGVLYVRNEEQVIVQHEEHKPITLEPGIWEVGRVREYDYFLEMTRTVKD